MKRYGPDGALVDNLSYTYGGSTENPSVNKLAAVTDAVTVSTDEPYFSNAGGLESATYEYDKSAILINFSKL